jgi:amino acid transporter
MHKLTEFPLFVVVLTFFALLLSARIGVFFRKKRQHPKEDEYHDLDLIVTAVLTLLALIIGFSFSMAISRYDQRKNYEEAEANAIGTEYVRADLLPAADASRVRVLLTDYLDQRVLFYQTRDERELQQINARTAQLQTELWSAVHALPPAQQTPVVALAVSGMNDVLNSQGYTQAAWWNRIPIGAWILMVSVAICSNALIGYGARRVDGGSIRLIVLPLVLCIAFFLIADIDSPRRGIIRVHPQNLISLAQSLHGH